MVEYNKRVKGMVKRGKNGMENKGNKIYFNIKKKDLIIGYMYWD